MQGEGYRKDLSPNASRHLYESLAGAAGAGETDVHSRRNTMRKRKKMSMDEILTKYWPSPSQQEVEADCEEVWKQLEVELEKHDTSLWSLYGDGWSAAPLKQTEFQVLTAVSLLGDRGTLKSITAMVHKWTGREMVGHVYLTLGGLAERGIIALHSDPTWEYGEKPAHRFEITEDGDRALRRAKIEGKELVTDREDGLAPPMN